MIIVQMYFDISRLKYMNDEKEKAINEKSKHPFESKGNLGTQEECMQSLTDCISDFRLNPKNMQCLSLLLQLEIIFFAEGNNHIIVFNSFNKRKTINGIIDQTYLELQIVSKYHLSLKEEMNFYFVLSMKYKNMNPCRSLGSHAQNAQVCLLLIMAI